MILSGIKVMHVAPVDQKLMTYRSSVVAMLLQFCSKKFLQLFIKVVDFLFVTISFSDEHRFQRC